MFVCNNIYPSLVHDENYKTSVCNQLGKWEPNPHDICKLTSNSGSDSNCVTECSLPNSVFYAGNPYAWFSNYNRNNILIIVAALLAAMVFITTVICMTFTRGCCFMKSQTAKKMSHFESAVTPVYEEVLPNSLYHHPDKDPDPELKENMAYGPCTTLSTCMSISVSCHTS